MNLKLSKHQKRNIRNMAKTLADEVVLVSKMVSTKNIDEFEADQRLTKVCQRMMARDGLHSALLGLSFFRGMVEANAPGGSLQGVTLITDPVEAYFEKFDQTNIPHIHLENDKNKPAPKQVFKNVHEDSKTNG